MPKISDRQRQRLYRTWNGMMSCCYNTNRHNYKYYGAIGIDVCPEWHSFENFVRDMYPRPLHMSIERKDGAKGYYKDNCIWATRKQQQSNRRGNHAIPHNGTTVTLTEYCRIHNLSFRAMANHFVMRWPLERILTQPIRKSPNRPRKCHASSS